jgi:hypothetical protein
MTKILEKVIEHYNKTYPKDIPKKHKSQMDLTVRTIMAMTILDTAKLEYLHDTTFTFVYKPYEEFYFWNT